MSAHRREISTIRSQRVRIRINAQNTQTRGMTVALLETRRDLHNVFAKLQIYHRCDTLRLHTAEECLGKHQRALLSLEIRHFMLLNVSRDKLATYEQQQK